jgi:DNA-binding NarL/FixJ family response regulator
VTVPLVASPDGATATAAAPHGAPARHVVTRVLLVDDHTMLRQSLRRSLEAEGLEIVGEAGDGEEATRLAIALRPDVVVMDVSMPQMDGIDACRRIMGADARQRVVMLTMHVDRDVVERALKAGAVGYLTKDASIREVVDAVRMAVHHDRILSPKLAEAMLAHAADDGAGPVLSPREEELLQLVADGLSTPDVAAAMFISQKTVKNHLASIYEKLDARDRTQAVVTAVRMGIIKLV